MDTAEPPKIVLETPAPCADAGHADDVLRRTLAPARAPSGAWTVWLRVTNGPGGALRGEGEVTDANRAPVAHRDFISPDCAPLARAVGVWASLVLDRELARARAAVPVIASTAPAPPAAAALPKDSAVPEVSVWPAPTPNQPPPPEASLVLRHDEAHRTLETGASMFIMGGTGTGALAGPMLFAFAELGGGVFFRGALAVGRTLEALKPATDVYGTLGIARFDGCYRLPGLYLERRGMQLDTCAGADIGFLHFDAMSANQYDAQAAMDARTIPFLALGPSIGLRGDLASDLAVELRGVFGLNLIRESFTDPNATGNNGSAQGAPGTGMQPGAQPAPGTFVDPPLFGGRAELGISWRWR